MRLQNKIAIVTGAGQGIGRGIAVKFASEGAIVIVADQNLQTAKATRDHILQAGGQAYAMQVDVGEPNSVRQFMDRLQDQFEKLHILVNNAGISQFAPVEQLSVETWDRILHVNLRGAFLCSQMAAPLMKKAGVGSIINIASTRALMSEPGNEAYAASKGGLLSLTHAMANSLGPEIRVNAICPGWIHTTAESLRPEDHAQHPVGRVGIPQDIATACVFLAADESAFMTGQRLVIDGGMTTKMIYIE